MLDLQGKITNKFEKFSVYYHNLFDFPLTFSELLKWTPAQLPQNHKQDYEVICKKGYCFMVGREGLPYKRILRKRYSERKMLLAEKASKIMSIIPGIKMVAVSGSLAMQNSGNTSDIDLFIITEDGKLWTTRALTYLLLKICWIPIRRPNEYRQKDKLCLNMWFDEGDLVWRSPRNFYTAHEITQLIPLVNKNRAYEKFIWKNKWIKNYWPNAVKIYKIKDNIQSFKYKYTIFEKLIFWLQYTYMKPKITREMVTKKRAIFHPKDWTEVVMKKLSLDTRIQGT